MPKCGVETHGSNQTFSDSGKYSWAVSTAQKLRNDIRLLMLRDFGVISTFALLYNKNTGLHVSQWSPEFLFINL